MALLTGSDQQVGRLPGAPTAPMRSTEVTPMQPTTTDQSSRAASAQTNRVDDFPAMTEPPRLVALTTRVIDEQLPCRGNDPELFFADSPADVEVAKSLCSECPARQDCLAGAIARSEPWGVWGGEWFVAGVVVPRKRPRGRPRKSEVAA